MIWRVRRVVTGHDSDGQSTIISDGPADNIKTMAGMPGLALTDLWETNGAPASNEGTADAADRPVQLEPPRNGSILRLVEFPPDSRWRGATDGKAGFDSIGAGHAQDAHSSDPMMHKTATIDYIIVLKGEIYAILDQTETRLKPGDVFIQRGTKHSWSVRGDQPCIIAAVLISAAPIGSGKAATKRAGAKRAAKQMPNKVARKAAKKAAPKSAGGKTVGRAKAPGKKAASRPPATKTPGKKSSAGKVAAKRPAAGKRPAKRRKG